MSSSDSDPSVAIKLLAVRANLLSEISRSRELQNYISNLKLVDPLLHYLENIFYPGYSKNLQIYLKNLESSKLRLMSEELIGKRLGLEELKAILSVKLGDAWPGAIFYEMGQSYDDVVLPNRESVRKLLEAYYKTEDLEDSAYVLKFLSMRTSAGCLFLFKGIYASEFARFSKHEIKDSMFYLLGTGNQVIDFYQRVMTHGVERKPVSELQENEFCNAIIYDSFPVDSIADEKYKKIYESKRTNGRDLVSFFDYLPEIGKKRDKIQVGEVILAPDTWCLRKSDMIDNIFSEEWRVEIGLPSVFYLNLFNGIFRIDTCNELSMRKMLAEIFNQANKKIDKVYVENLDFCTDSDSVQEIYLGYSNEN
ncbi:lantibiotic dehydratase C-terminal domain protein [Bacteriovorax sp. Seq25_V]|uniref:lantibiotic dehydratase C-terminal domain protein n=1 Tax=Bacteriovorax sp. Seq25_V TaxID=1201288 RepID=UPI00038A448A|nr:lantibiotic dehydratase C-terminal domain protein [Bacteriovorax sp. Seq25_V]EQC45368.1 lantibiotic dehydratase, C-terminal domain protein [Bacteriovorax sp. Seq25_V]